MQGSVKDKETAIAGTDEVVVDPFFVVFLENIAVIYETLFDGRFHETPEQERDHCLFEHAVAGAVLVNVNPQHRFVRNVVVINISIQFLKQVFIIGYDVGFPKNHPVILLYQDFVYFVVAQLFNW